ncbi:MAG: O-antigen ligase family protein [Deltaproteobacteria bacterium]|nr:O-antigen ligase family protein [Deltaproteobacteria bacterium]
MKNVKDYPTKSILLERLFIAFLPPVLIASYFSNISNKVTGAIALFILWAVAFLELNNRGIIMGGKRALLFLTIALYLLLGSVPMFVNSSSPKPMLRDLLRYGLVLSALAFGAGDSIRRNFQIFANSTVLTVLMLSIFGFVTLFIGTYSIGPLTASQYYPLRIGRLTIPTTSSLMKNTNYYAITLAISYAILKFYGISFILRKSKIKYSLEIVLITAVILTKSRVGVALVLLMLAIQFLLWFNKISVRKKWGFILVGIGVIIGLITINQFEDGRYSVPVIRAFVTVWRDFFLKKGLNMRDILWSQGVKLFQQHPLGFGFGTISQVLLATGAPTTTVQNTFLTYLLIGGVPLTALVILIVFLSLIAYLRVYKLIHNIRAELRRFVNTMLAISLIVLVDGMARTYILGGIGFIPFMFSFAILGGIGWINVR